MTSKPNPKPLFYHEQVAIIYIRVSTEYQTQADSNSIETQKRLCRELCERKGIPVAKIIEQVRSGTKYRKELVEIVEKELKKGDAIVVWAVSRFARSQRTTHNLVEILRKKKCRLLSYSENLDTLEDDKFLGLYAWVAEMESKQISERVRMSLGSKRLRGEHMGSIPYGYKFVDGKGSPLEQDPEQMAIIARMRELRTAQNLSYYKIAKKLNADGVLSPKRKELCGWTAKTVEVILNRDETKIQTLGKRSWYAENDPDAIQDPTSSESEETEILEPETIEDQPVEKVEIEEPPEPKPNNPLTEKSIPVLRALAMRRKQELGLSDDEIRGLSKEDLVFILS